MGFALETSQAIRVECERLGQHLDRDLASERRVAGPIHLTHAARPEKAGDLEGPDARPEFSAMSRAGRVRL